MSVLYQWLKFSHNFDETFFSPLLRPRLILKHKRRNSLILKVAKVNFSFPSSQYGVGRIIHVDYSEDEGKKVAIAFTLLFNIFLKRVAPLLRDMQWWTFATPESQKRKRNKDPCPVHLSLLNNVALLGDVQTVQELDWYKLAQVYPLLWFIMRIFFWAWEEQSVVSACPNVGWMCLQTENH